MDVLKTLLLIEVLALKPFECRNKHEKVRSYVIKPLIYHN